VKYKNLQFCYPCLNVAKTSLVHFGNYLLSYFFRDSMLLYQLEGKQKEAVEQKMKTSSNSSSRSSGIKRCRI